MATKKRPLAAVLASASLLCLAADRPDPARAAAAKAPAPATARVPVTDTYHGVTVTDDYRWLENGDDPKVKAWSEAQNAHARAFLDHLPGMDALRAEVEKIVTAQPASIHGFVRRGGKLFAVRSDPAKKQQPWIVLLSSLESLDGMRTLFDPNTLDPSGRTTFDWFVPSPDGGKLAVSISSGGSESGTLHVFDVATGKETGDVIPRAQVGTGGGSLAWTADSKGFFYTRYPREGERPKEDLDFWQKLYFHPLGGKEAEDGLALGKDLPRIAEITALSSEDGRQHLALVENGDSGDYALWLRLEDAKAWTRISDFADGIVEARFGRDGAIWAISKKGAPTRRVLRIPLETPSLTAARVVVPEGDSVIEGLAPAASRLYVVESRGGLSKVRAYDFSGKSLGDLPTPPISTAGGLQALDGDRAFYTTTSDLTPRAGVVYDPSTKAVSATVVKDLPVADLSAAEVVEESAVSKDGTKVPMFIVQPKGLKRDGRNPALLTGYGGYNISMTPHYSDLRKLSLERGVVEVTALLRGGGEFGEAWHDAGRLTRKQNVFDDFLACARRLIELKITSPERLAIQGGSNGGLLMGAAFTQQPSLFKTVVSHVGIYDMLRSETSANGQFNAVEFGSVKDPEQFRALHAYSPYHHVKDGTHYPSILMPTGANDPRVDPMQSRKMIARLQAADPSGTILLRTSSGMGHGGIGAGVKDVVALIADTAGFLFHELGVPLAPKMP
jgi:prolyl oligopeptidase